MNTQNEAPNAVDLWLIDWAQKDYSWSGLGTKAGPLPGVSLKEFWKRSPAGIIRTDEQLLAEGRLIDCGDRGVFHVAYLPKKWFDEVVNVQGETTAYPDLLDVAWGEKLDALQTGPPTVLKGAFVNSSGAATLGSTPRLSFEECVFLEDIAITRVDGNRTFENCLFLANVKSNGVGISQKNTNLLKFEACAFFGDIDFESENFDCELKLDGCEFHGSFRIWEAKFSRRFRIEVCRFHNNFSISQAQFSKPVSVFECDVSGDFNIYDSHFHEEVSFNEMSLRGDVEIVASRFEERTRFADIDWPKMDSNVAWGHETHFSKEVAFSSIRTPPVQFFDDMRFGGEASFPRTSEKEWLTAFNAELKGIRKLLPMHSAPTEMRQLEGGCRTLRKLAAANGNVHLEHQWHRCELIARRSGFEVSMLERGLSYVYGFCSDYGLSISRPFLILALLCSLFAVAYSAIFSGIKIPGTVDWQSLTEGFGYSINRALPIGVFEFSDSSWRKQLLGNAGTWKSIAVRAIASAQTIISVFLIYLGIMAARRKFKIS